MSEAKPEQEDVAQKLIPTISDAELAEVYIYVCSSFCSQVSGTDLDEGPGVLVPHTFLRKIFLNF